MFEPTARNPWTVTLCWTPEQNHGAVSVWPGRSPVHAIVAMASAGTPVVEVAAEYGVSVATVRVLCALAVDLAPENAS